MYSKEKIINRIMNESKLDKAEVETFYDTFLNILKEDLSKGKFVLYPVGIITMKTKNGKWYSNHEKRVVEGEKVFFKFIPFKNYKKEVKEREVE
jgi:nucleoid DNA-binding protein